MTLWHLAWMFTSIAVSFVLTAALPFVWGYAWDYTDAALQEQTSLLVPVARDG